MMLGQGEIQFFPVLLCFQGKQERIFQPRNWEDIIRHRDISDRMQQSRSHSILSPALWKKSLKISPSPSWPGANLPKFYLGNAQIVIKSKAAPFPLLPCLFMVCLASKWQSCLQTIMPCAAPVQEQRWGHGAIWVIKKPNTMKNVFNAFKSLHLTKFVRWSFILCTMQLGSGEERRQPGGRQGSHSIDFCQISMSAKFHWEERFVQGEAECLPRWLLCRQVWAFQFTYRTWSQAKTGRSRATGSITVGLSPPQTLHEISRFCFIGQAVMAKKSRWILVCEEE